MIKKTFNLEEETMKEINNFDISNIRNIILEMDSLEDRISYLEECLGKINDLVYEISTDLEEYFSDNENSVELTQQNISAANYKQLLLRNYRFFILEEMIIWKNEQIAELRKQLDE
ncbi:MAG TPA: hypothetical protein PL041_09715 [Melioribacteraceae bacterium]|nr:hypothetical protein [Melioribacteraceae bacterium]